MQLVLKLKTGSNATLQEQLFGAIREQILQGRLKAGAMMPATRALGEQLGISRNTVVLTYDRLTAEGYLESQPTVGTFVTSALPENALFLKKFSNDYLSLDGEKIDERWAARHPIAFQGRAQNVVNPNQHKLSTDFWVGRPDPHSFPLKPWRRYLLHHLSTAGTRLTTYGDPAGIPELRKAIADHLGPARGITATPEQIVVVNGSQGALNLVARLLVDKGTNVVVECPCYQGAAFLFESYGANLIPVRVDKHGIDTSNLPRKQAGLIFVTPSHQYPTGGTLPLERRAELLDWAWETGAYVLEDDYDSDFRYQGSPLSALFGLDQHGCVIYMGTFSKSIGAGIRLGYLVLPQDLVESARTVKALLDNGHAWLDQVVLADFISSGSYTRHLRHIRHNYRKRRDCLINALRHHFGDVQLTGIEGGMHIIWHLPDGFPDAKRVQQIAEETGVGVYALEAGAAVCLEEHACNQGALMFGYSSLTESAIEDGVARLSKALSTTV
tara:strand:- start:86 stop:1579 length:1494 start_codon:yes stop_codon:yes gene_type:complete